MVSGHRGQETARKAAWCFVLLGFGGRLGLGRYGDRVIRQVQSWLRPLRPCNSSASAGAHWHRGVKYQQGRLVMMAFLGACMGTENVILPSASVGWTCPT